MKPAMTINVTGLNPFEIFNTAERNDYDDTIFFFILGILNVSARIINTPLIRNLKSYVEHPNDWVIEQLTNGDADLSSHTVILFPESPRSVRYSLAIDVFRPELFYKAQSLRQAFNIYTLPFSIDVWLTLLSLLLTITVALTFILSRETRLPHDTPFDIIARIADEEHEKGVDWSAIHASKNEIRTREHWEVDEILLVTLGASCQQGPPRDPSTLAARIVLLALFILSMSVYTAYSASVISLISLLPNTDRESHLGWTPVRNNGLFVQDHPFFRKSFDIPTNNKLFTTISEGFTSVVDGERAFLGDRDISINSLHKQSFPIEARCTIGTSFLGVQYHRVFAFRNTTLFLNKFNSNILKLRQFGILNREHKRFFKSDAPCSMRDRDRMSGFTSITLTDIEPPLKFFCFGIVTAFILLIIEHVVHYSSWELRRLFYEPWVAVDKKVEKTLKKWSRKKLQEHFKRNKLLIQSDISKPATAWHE